MIIVKNLIILVVMGIVPFLLGRLVTYKDRTMLEKNIICSYIIGFFTMLAVFQMICVPLTYMYASFRLLVTIYSSVITIMCFISIYMNRNKSKLSFGEKWKKYEWIYVGIFCVLMIVQLYHALFYEASYMSADDFDYVVYATSALQDDKIYTANVITGENIALNPKRTLNSYLIFIAYLAKVSGFHTTIIAHTILPVVLIMAAYGVYYLLADYLFEKRDNKLIFMIILAVLNIYGEYSHYSMTFRLLGTIWQGKAIAISIGIPFLFILLQKIFQAKYSRRGIWYLLLVTTGMCSLTMMGVGFSIPVILLMAFVYGIWKKEKKYVVYAIGGCFIPVVHLALYVLMR